MEITINIDDYLSEEDKVELARESFRAACSREMKDEAGIKRQLSNCAYEMVYARVDEILGEDTKELISREVSRIIKKKDGLSYSIFKKPDAWDREPNSAYLHLQKCIKENMPKIDEIIAQQIEPQTVIMLLDSLPDFINDAIISAIRKD